MRVRKAVIPVAGLGTRFLPATKAVPKEMLPIVDTPTLQLIVEEAFAAGIETVVLVTGRGKDCILDHFDYHPLLESTLAKKGKDTDVAMLRGIADRGNVVAIRQKAPLGLGHAVLAARPVVGDEPFAVLLGDDLFFPAPGQRPGVGQCIDEFARTGRGNVGLMQVPRDQVYLYGAAEGQPDGARRIRIRALVEKPPKGTEKTDLVIIGRYVLPASIFGLIEQTKPGAGGEIQLTDAMATLVAREGMDGIVLDGERVDAGDKIGYLRANLLYALSRPDLRAGAEQLVREFAGRLG